jgi:hypothetical protein
MASERPKAEALGYPEARNKQRQGTSNGKEQATARNKQRQGTSNGKEQATARTGNGKDGQRQEQKQILTG